MDENQKKGMRDAVESFWTEYHLFLDASENHYTPAEDATAFLAFQTFLDWMHTNQVASIRNMIAAEGAMQALTGKGTIVRN